MTKISQINVVVKITDAGLWNRIRDWFFNLRQKRSGSIIRRASARVNLESLSAEDAEKIRRIFD